MSDIFVADTDNYRIKKHSDVDWAYISKIGSYGSGNDNFNDANGITCDDTYVYVADRGNSRIVKRLRSDLSYVSEIGTEGSGNDQFYIPSGITTDGTHLFIADEYNHRIKKHLCSDLSYVSHLGGPTEGTSSAEFSYPTDITADNYFIYIVERGAIDRVRKHLKSDLSWDSWLGSYGTENDQFKIPRGITTDGTYLYISDWANNRIKKHKVSDLAYVAQQISGYTRPAGISTDGTYIYTAVEWDHKLVKADTSLAFVSSLDNGQGSGDTQVNGPQDIETAGWFARLFQKDLHEFSLNQLHALTGVSGYETFLNQHYLLDAPALVTAQLNQMYALTGVTLEQFQLNQLYAQAGVTLIESELNHLYALTGATLIEGSFNEQYALAGVALFESRFNQMYSALVSKGEIFHIQKYRLTGNPLPTPELVDIFYTLEIEETVVPMSSFQGRVRDTGQDYVSVVVPNGKGNIVTFEGLAGTGKELVIKRGGYTRAGHVLYPAEEFLRVEFETIRYDRGGKSSALTLVGHRDVVLGTSKGVKVKDVEYINVDAGGLKTIRCRFDSSIRVGDQAELPDESLMTIGAIAYTVGVSILQMQLTEAET